MIMKSILRVCEQFGFLHKEISASKYCVALAGTILLENLKHEWLQSFVNHKDYTIFFTNLQFIDGYTYVKKMCMEKLPYGFATIQEEIREEDISLDSYVNESRRLKTWVFIPSKNSQHAFVQWQKQRRMWWRKFSAVPDRYFTTQLIMEEGCQEININAKYPWGDEVVEILRFTKAPALLTSEGVQDVHHDKKNASALTLSSEINLGTMYLNTICDAFEILKQPEGERSLLKFHRKLAPYKVGFALSYPRSGHLTADLKDLTNQLCKKLRGNNIASLMLPNIGRATLEAQFMNLDHLGVPYAIVLSENTLKNGILYLRSRDTTIKEQVPVAELPNYVSLLFKND